MVKAQRSVAQTRRRIPPGPAQDHVNPAVEEKNVGDSFSSLTPTKSFALQEENIDSFVRLTAGRGHDIKEVIKRNTFNNCFRVIRRDGLPLPLQESNVCNLRSFCFSEYSSQNQRGSKYQYTKTQTQRGHSRTSIYSLTPFP